MFDWIKVFFGLPSCRGCRWRRFFGLYCGCRARGFFRPRAWDFTGYACWYYANPPRTGREDPA